MIDHDSWMIDDSSLPSMHNMHKVLLAHLPASFHPAIQKANAPHVNSQHRVEWVQSLLRVDMLTHSHLTVRLHVQHT